MTHAAEKDRIRQARGKFAAMAVAYSLGAFNDNFFKQAAMLMAIRAGFESFQGYAIVLFTAPFILLAAPAGWLADRFAKRRIVISAKALELAAMVCGAVGFCTGSWPLILLMIMTMGLQSTMFSPSLNGSIPELFPAGYVTKANGILKMAVTAAILLGVAAGGIALDRPGSTWGIPAGRFVVAVVALAVAALGLAVSLGVPFRPAAAPRTRFPWTGPVATVRTLAAAGRDRLLAITLAADVFIWFIGSLQILLINLMGSKELGLRESLTSLMAAAELSGVAVGGLLSSRIARGRRWHRVLAPAAGALGVLMLLVPLAVGMPAAARLPCLLGLLALAGAAGGLVLIPCEAFIQIRPARERKGAVIAAANSAAFLGILISGPTVNGLAAAMRPSRAFLVVGAGTLAVAAGLAFLLSGRAGRALDIGLRWFARSALWLRYRIRLVGEREIARRGRRGILFLPNHPALIDPVIVGTMLHRTFRPRFLADRDQIDRFFIRWVAGRIGAIPIPDPAKLGAAARAEVEQGLGKVVEALRRGENVVLYPVGHLMHNRLESLRGNTAVRRVLDQVPDVRVVLVRTRGLWGSSFGYARGLVPNVAANVRRGLLRLLASGVFFAPRRAVTVELHEPADLPRSADRESLNRYLEAFYNAAAQPATHVPYSLWERGGVRTLGEPDWRAERADLSAVPEATREIVAEYLREQTGVDEIDDAAHLARDLGLDSLGEADLLAWLSGEFGLPVGDVEALQTVGDVLLAACGQSFTGRLSELKPVPAAWFPRKVDATALEPPRAETIGEAFLAQARRAPGRIVLADQLAGARTYRDVIAAVLALRGPIAALPGRHVGVLLPAGVAADVVYLATLFAGRTPVMVNWTVGPRNLDHCLRLVGVERIVTAEALIPRLTERGLELAGAADRLVFLERIARRVGRLAKLRAWVGSRLRWVPLRRAAAAMKPADTAVVLFTSGSEALPKAVPLSHANILANLADIAALRVVRADDRLVGILPPFHSFGLTVTTVLPLCLGVPVVHHPDPTEAPVLARLIEAYRATLLVGTPTFLGGIARAGRREQLTTLRLAVTGAEQCPDRIYEALERVHPDMVVLEGYGVTECSPIISVNRPEGPRRGTIGPPVPSIEHAVVHPETLDRVRPGEVGLLLVRGPSVFAGYLGAETGAPDAFVDFDGRRWYRTGDLVSEDADGVLTFRGRLKRFVKLGGEMISLPAIEAVLAEHFRPPGEEEGAVLAVEATPSEEHPEIVLFTTRALSREAANRRIREAGLSALHNVRRVIRVDEIPLLGTGKTDYRALRRRLEEGS